MSKASRRPAAPATTNTQLPPGTPAGEAFDQAIREAVHQAAHDPLTPRRVRTSMAELERKLR